MWHHKITEVLNSSRWKKCYEVKSSVFNIFMDASSEWPVISIFDVYVAWLIEILSKNKLFLTVKLTSEVMTPWIENKALAKKMVL